MSSKLSFNYSSHTQTTILTQLNKRLVRTTFTYDQHLIKMGTRTKQLFHNLEIHELENLQVFS